MTSKQYNFLEERPFLQFLSELNEENQSRLYESRACVLAVFRLLPPIAKRCILNLLFGSKRLFFKFLINFFVLVLGPVPK